MKKLNGYMAGVNLGGWLSQYAEGNLARDPEHHFDRFITREDIRKIASWGMDHVRLPFDYPLLEDDDNPFVYKEEGFRRVDDCLAWCKEFGLNLVLDLHRAPGFAFQTPEENTLFESDFMQKRISDIWKAFAERYKGEGQNIVFELLNEIVEPDSTRWNKLATQIIQGIREIDKEHYIIVGGINYNSVMSLKDMPIFDDPRIIYNFHMYEPFCLTHQHAPWTVMKNNPNSFVYPSPVEPYLAHFGDSVEGKIIQKLPRVDKAFVEAFLQPAIEFVKKHDLPLYCGEYGVIELADMDSRAAWVRDVAEVCLENGIGRAVWSYKMMDFRLVDEESRTVSDALVAAAALK